MKRSMPTRLAELLFQPRQIMIMDTAATGRPYRFHLRLVTVITIILLVAALGVWGGYIISSHDYFRLADKEIRMQLAQRMQIRRYENQLAEASSELVLRQSQIESLKKDMRSQHKQAEQLKQRLQMFESILAAQKTAGIHILKAEANWQKGERLTFRLVLVKGGSFPRRVSGSIRLTARGPNGQAFVLPLGKKASELPYQMETHTFLRGNLAWTRDWIPNRILVSRLNRKGVIREEIEIPIEGERT